ncbi:MAG: UDP-N-acetylmuramoyl-tripeptide--D-alanyl-D-alanine ligase [Dethiobacter sp.]|jgi:UDP-N-acetylmuramoyl-tripeptide--D-alanyl-D-alanine ligase|nr:MAG: UDP-N-acetylmuramoyl-tripeptide--D-alanyl-D-alanine ligase [Dethiobacter sp.]
MLFSVEEVLNVTGGKLWLGDLKGSFHGAVIDSREAGGGELFFPLQGEKENGHKFILDALTRGANGSLLEEEQIPRFTAQSFPPGKSVITVKDSLQSLQKLAGYHRGKFSLSLVAVTGSNGKTTTKDFIASVLSTRYNVLKTEGNLNNHLGLPLMLLRLKKEHQAAVLELGMSGLGEIALLTSLCRPDLGVITNIGEAHLGLLGSKENIARAKGELLVNMDSRGKAILNGDDPFLKQMGREFAGQTFYYGFTEGTSLRVLNSFMDNGGYKFEVLLPDSRVESFWISLPGKHNVYNALAAIAVGLDFSLSLQDIKEGLAESVFSRMRMEKTPVKSGFWVINDAYNANPTSMKYSLQSLKELARNNVKIAILGDMFELGPAAEDRHYELGRILADLGIDYLISVGRLAVWIAQGAGDAGLPPERIFLAGNHEEAVKHVDSLNLPGSYILIKGSRGMQMEKIAGELLKKYN